MLTQQAVRDLALAKAGSYSNAGDVIEHTLYDTRYFNTTISDGNFFVQPIGAAWRSGIKSITETNMSDSGKLPTGQSFLVQRVGVSFQSYLAAAATDAEIVAQAFYNIMQSSVFELRIAGREFDLQVPGSSFVPAIPITGTGSTVGINRIGDTISSGYVKLVRIPIPIGNQVNFQVIQRLGNPDSNVLTVLNAAATELNGNYSTMQVKLEGALQRRK